MSTDVAQAGSGGSAAELGQFPWQTAPALRRPPIVRPLLADDADASVHQHGARDLVLPALVTERAGAAEREGYDCGFSEGVLAGREIARQLTEAHLSRLNVTITELSSLRTAMLQRSETDIVRLAIAIAERIVRREIRVNRPVLLTMAQAAARKLGDHGLVTIQMHPDDLLAVTGSRDAAPQDGPVRLSPDAAVPLGGCLVQSAFGTINLGMDAQMREIVRDLLGEDAECDLAGDAGAAG
jgi:flagellar assembly protein FliH